MNSVNKGTVTLNKRAKARSIGSSDTRILLRSCIEKNRLLAARCEGFKVTSNLHVPRAYNNMLS
jgi:hypothetical protein